MSKSKTDDDRTVASPLPPVPPVQPSSEDCCNSGCNPCVFDLYEEAMERYRAEYRAWAERKAGKQTLRS